MNSTEVKTIDELPELPFKRILSYLSLEHLIRSRAVSRGWYHRINSFRVKSLCYSEGPSGFIFRKSRWVSGAFAQNFISSTRFASFFDTFSQKILSNLKHLRICDLELDDVNGTLARTLNSFGQLEELDMIQFHRHADFKREMEVELNLPMLQKIHLRKTRGMKKLTLDAPRLKKIKIRACDVKVWLVHVESVEKLLVNDLDDTEVKNLKNLQFLYIVDLPDIDSTFLSSLQQLKEIHLFMLNNRYQRPVISELFQQKRRYGLVKLKVYLRGLQLSGPDDPAIDFLDFQSVHSKDALRCLAENSSRLADEIQFEFCFCDKEIERIPLGSEISLLSRFTELDDITVTKPVENVQRFLNLLNFCTYLGTYLDFLGNQPQELFDRLPEHCPVVQWLTIYTVLSDFRFLFRLKNLIHLHLLCPIDAQTVRKLLEELPYLSWFEFQFNENYVNIKTGHLKPFNITINQFRIPEKRANLADSNAVLQFILENAS